MTLIETNTAFCHFLYGAFYFQYDRQLQVVAQVFQRPFPVSAVAQGGIGGEVFYIVEAVEIPVRDEPNRQVIIKDDIIMKVARPVGILA